MIRLKDVKNEFHCIKCITIKNGYNIYSLNEKGKRTNHLYLGYVIVADGLATHYPSEQTFNNIEDLKLFANQWAKNCEYESSTYNPDNTKGSVAELRIHDWMINHGFNADFNTYTLKTSSLINEHTIKVCIKTEWINGNDYTINGYIDCGSNGYIDISSDNYENVIASVNNIVKIAMLDKMAVSLSAYEIMSDGNLDNINEMMLSKLNGFNVEQTSFKSFIIDKLENILTELKK